MVAPAPPHGGNLLLARRVPPAPPRADHRPLFPRRSPARPQASRLPPQVARLCTVLDAAASFAHRQVRRPRRRGGGRAIACSSIPISAMDLVELAGIHTTEEEPRSWIEEAGGRLWTGTGRSGWVDVASAGWRRLHPRLMAKRGLGAPPGT
ncbi:unnamed protein product [Urochloa humidicola]